MPDRRSCRSLPLAAALVCALAGCARTLVERPTPTDYDPAIIEDRVGFWHALPGRPAITNDEGLHAVLAFLYADDPARGYEDRLALARERGLVGSDFDEAGSLAMQRGTLARALVRGLGIEGGVMLALTDEHPRYATKELQYLGIMPSGTELRAISGLELLGVITNAEAWREANARAVQPTPAARAAEDEPRAVADEEAAVTAPSPLEGDEAAPEPEGAEGRAPVEPAGDG